MEIHLLEGQIPPLRNSSYLSRYFGRKDKKRELFRRPEGQKRRVLSFRLSGRQERTEYPFVIPIERTPGANRGICYYFITMEIHLLEGQIPPLRNSS